MASFHPTIISAPYTSTITIPYTVERDDRWVQNYFIQFLKLKCFTSCKYLWEKTNYKQVLTDIWHQWNRGSKMSKRKPLRKKIPTRTYTISLNCSVTTTCPSNKSRKGNNNNICTSELLAVTDSLEKLTS